jgi:4-hydroxy-3-methylbut-2-enyl diphosphate reductase
VDDTDEIVAILRRRFPAVEAPKKDDICYATTNRQRAVKRILSAVDLLLVIGSRNSSNSNRLVDVARAGGVDAYLIDDESEIDEAWLDGVESVGLTSGASAPESLVRRVVGWFRERGVSQIESLDDAFEDVFFKLPREVRADAVTRT